MRVFLFLSIIFAASANAQDDMPTLHFQADSPVVWGQNGPHFGGQFTGQIQLGLQDEGETYRGNAWSELLTRESDPLSNFAVDSWQDYQFREDGDFIYSIEPNNSDLSQVWARNQIQATDLNDFLSGNPAITRQLDIPLADLGPYRALLSASDGYEIPSVISDLDYSGFGLSPVQASEIQRLLAVAILNAGIVSNGIDNCEACAGVGVAPGGPVIIPPILGVAGVPTAKNYRDFVGDIAPDLATLETNPEVITAGLHRRLALLKIAVTGLVEDAEERRHEPRISFVENVADDFWSSTSIAVVVESEVLDAMDRRSLVGFQVTLREQEASAFTAENSRRTDLIVDGYVRRSRAWFNPGAETPALDEDFERMLYDISASNRREQELADLLLSYLTAL